MSSRKLLNPRAKEKLPIQNISKWNPPVKDEPIKVPRATIEDNYVSGVNFIEQKKGVRNG